MIKAWRCRACGHWLQQKASAALRYNPNANGDCTYYEHGKCTIDFPAGKVHDSCDLKTVAITPLAEHEEVQAVLATAEEQAINIWICPRYTSDSSPEYGCTYYIEESKRADKGKGPGCYKYSVCRATLVKFVPWDALTKIRGE